MTEQEQRKVVYTDTYRACEWYSDSGQKKTYEPDPKPVAKPKKGKRGK